MKDLFDLAANKPNCYNEVYNPSMITAVKNLFPLTIHTELNRNLTRSATIKEQLDGILAHIKTMKEEQQEMYKDVGGADSGGTKADYSSYTPYRDKGQLTLQEVDQVNVLDLSDEEFLAYTATYTNEETEEEDDMGFGLYD